MKHVITLKTVMMLLALFILSDVNILITNFLLICVCIEDKFLPILVFLKFLYPYILAMSLKNSDFVFQSIITSFVF